MTINCSKSDINHVNLVLGFKMIKRVLNGAKLHAKLEKEPTAELQKLHAELKLCLQRS